MEKNMEIATQLLLLKLTKEGLITWKPGSGGGIQADLTFLLDEFDRGNKLRPYLRIFQIDEEDADETVSQVFEALNDLWVAAVEQSGWPECELSGTNPHPI